MACTIQMKAAPSSGLDSALRLTIAVEAPGEALVGPTAALPAHGVEDVAASTAAQQAVQPSAAHARQA